MNNKNKALIEAALYISGRPLNLEELGEVVNLDINLVNKLVVELMDDYNERGSALEITSLSGGRYALQLKSDYSPMVARFAPSGLLSLGALKTLSLIALRQPIRQTEVVRIRGSHVYKHIHELMDRGFLEGRPDGRTRILSTTKMFADYFGFDYDLRRLKLQLRWLMRKIKSEEEVTLEEKLMLEPTAYDDDT
ncbi:MAG: SMC-Scp complex subunit ScpB [Candidatus Hodarchaeota archaeon]